MQGKLRVSVIAVLVVDIIGLLLELAVGFGPELLTGAGAFTGDIGSVQPPYDAFLKAGVSVIAAIFALNGVSKERKNDPNAYDYPVMDDPAGDSDGTVADLIAIILVLAVLPVMNVFLGLTGTFAVTRLGNDAIAAYGWMSRIISLIWFLPGWCTTALLLVCGIDIGRKKDPAIL